MKKILKVCTVEKSLSHRIYSFLQGRAGLFLYPGLCAGKIKGGKI
jgi:hypothetical protein